MLSLGLPEYRRFPIPCPQLLIQDVTRPVTAPPGRFVVNTCDSSERREESYSELSRLAETKRPVNCSSPRMPDHAMEEVARRVPGVDGILGTRR